jgi:hypothetical protein
MLIADPNLAKLLKLMELPNCTASSTETCSPKRPKLFKLMLLPKRTAERTDNVEPIWKKSKILSDEPNLH